MVFYFESSSSKKSEYRVEWRVAVATVNNVILDANSSVILPSLCQDCQNVQTFPDNNVLERKYFECKIVDDKEQISVLLNVLQKEH